MLRGKGRLKPTTQVIAITLADLEKVQAAVITVEALKLEKVIPAAAAKVKVIATGAVSKKLTLKGIVVTEGARKQIEAVGGTIEN
jgi:large subunit ribosomal protein L15